MGAKILLESETSNTMTVIGVGMVAGGYILSIVDANLSAKKINQLSNQKIEAMKLKN